MKILIIGGDAAGMSAAMQMVRNSSGHEITVLYSYGQCGLPYVISGKIDSTDELIARTPSTFKEKYGIDARVFHEVQMVDVENKMVSGINHSNGEPCSLPYDRLLRNVGTVLLFQRITYINIS